VAIGSGSSVADHAAERGITIGTARIQLKQVLAKTATGRQSELVRRLLECGAARYDGPPAIDIDSRT